MLDSDRTLSREPLQQQIKDKHKLLSETARRRGFFWGSFEIYGGVSGFLDLGPYGVTLRRRLEDEWRNIFLSPTDSWKYPRLSLLLRKSWKLRATWPTSRIP